MDGDGAYDHSGQSMTGCSEVRDFPTTLLIGSDASPERPAGELLQDSDVADLIASDSAMASGR
jgi:hypothetical protein